MNDKIQARPRENVKRYRWAIVGGVATAVACMVVIGLGLGVGLAGATNPSRNTVSYTCPISGSGLSVSISGPPSGSGAREVVNVVWYVQNDEDSGLVGYWALDTYTVYLHVWYLTRGVDAGTYWMTQSFAGDFVTPQGALSPQSGATEFTSGFGTLEGLIPSTLSSVTFLGTLNYPTSGSLGAMNYGGTSADLALGTYSSQTGDSHAFNPVAAYFSADPGTTLAADQVNSNFGFIYSLNSEFISTNNTWCNFAGGDVGDIATS